MQAFRLLTYKTTEGPRAGVLAGDRVFDAARLTGRPADASVLAIVQDWDAAEPLIRDKLATARDDFRPLAEIELALPLRPETIYCAGANYQDHMDAIGRKFGTPPEPDPRTKGLKPFFFIKPSHCAVGPGSVIEPAGEMFDYEVELAAVIGRTTRDIPVERALEAVAAYTVANDLSARDRIQREGAAMPFRFDWVAHKAFDGSCPLGPWLTPASQVADPQDLRLKTWVNDEIRQDGHSGKMIFSLAEQIAHLSTRQTLHPGDIILTGTPMGVGAETGNFLKRGDAVKTEIEGLGALTIFVAGAA